jgi:putative ABC transport system permease protein
MIKNYLKIALRNFRGHKIYTFINLFGLAVGMAACVLIALFIQNERSFDAWHAHKDRIYRLNEVQSWEGITPQHVALSMYPMGPAMLDDFPEVEDFARIRSGPSVLNFGEKQLSLESFYADSTFLSVFSFPLLAGEPVKSLSQPDRVVLTQTTAQRLFGETDPVGQPVLSEGKSFLVTGVVADAPKNSHLQFDALFSMLTIDSERLRNSWGTNSFNTYLLLKSGADVAQLQGKFPDFVGRYLGEESRDTYQLYLQPLSDIHLGSAHITHDYHNFQKFAGDYVSIFAMLGVFVLLIACVNFTNLATARSASRAREIGIRKTVGAKRVQLLKQFVGESVLSAFFALILALLIVELFLPALNNISGRALDLDFRSAPSFAVALLFGALLVGVIAGIYPALFLSSFQPVKVLKSGASKLSRKGSLHDILVVAQFAIAIAMITGTTIAARQLNFMREKNMGFNKEQVVVLPMNRSASETYATLKQELSKLPGVLDVTGSIQRLGNNIHQMGLRAESADTLRVMAPSNTVVDFNYLSFYELELVAGRGFSEEFAADRRGNSFVVNEAFVQDMRWEEAIGKGMRLGWQDTLGAVVGVVKDFHFNSLHNKIGPLVMSYQPDWGFREISVRVAGGDLQTIIAVIENKWRSFAPETPFQYTFLDQHFEEIYRTDQQLSQVLGIVTGLAIIIACLGLFGLMTLAAGSRTKEIGIRKVLGASVAKVVSMLSKDFVKLVLLANIIAWPVAWFVMDGWLQDFAYRIEIGWWMFGIAGGSALLIALLTVSVQAIKAALANPVDSLRYE